MKKIYQEEFDADSVVIEYLNRLSDFIFVLARKVGKDFGVGEVAWQPRKDL